MSDHSNTIPVMPPEYSGRLELTWTNKHRRLLAHEDGTYEWVDPGDHRVAEVRLLKEAGVVAADEGAQQTAGENLLIRGDALAALTSLIKLPEYAAKYRGRVRLVYIDPPFNTGQAFENYDDNLEHSVWLTMMRDRLMQIREFLSADGSVWLHLDDRESHRARVVLDEVFGADNFVASIIWQKSHTRENRTDISTTHDYIHVYAKDRRQWATRRNLLPPSHEQLGRYSNPDDDPRGPWASLPAHAKAEKGRRASQFYTVVTPSGRTVDPPNGRCWLFTSDRMEELIADGRIWFGEKGVNAPRLKKFLSEVQQGLVPVSIWPHGEVGTTGTAKAEIVALFPDHVPFSTPKPERLMERIIHIGSNPGDIVLDAFAGSGTTAAVAHKMSRRWVGMEWSEDTLAAFTIPRLTKVVKGEDPGGITEVAEWTGGGGFRILDVAPSMFSEEDGIVYLADWAADDELAEPVAAQLGFKYQPDPPFCGRKGRTRLAVIDGMLTPEVVDLLADRIADGETLSVAATSIHPDAEARLGERVKGYALRKVPESILAEYASTYRRRRQKELGIRSTATGDND